MGSGASLSPYLPESIHVGVVQPKYRIETRGFEAPHETADGAMHGSVGSEFQPSGAAAVMTEAGDLSAEAAAGTVAGAGKHFFIQTGKFHVGGRHIDIARRVV